MAAILVVVFFGEEQAELRIRTLSSRVDASGSHRVTFMVTNGSSDVFPSFATVTTADGDGNAPYLFVETKMEDGWQTTRTPTNRYSYSHYLLPSTYWRFQTSLDASDRPQRVVLRYTVGIRKDAWMGRKAHELLKDLNLTEDWRELRSAIIEANN